MSRVLLDHVSKRFGPVAAVDDVSLEIRDGEFVTLLGPSGCGKTTTLRMIAGLVMPSQGEVVIGEHTVTRLPPRMRNIGMVFQNYALFPHMTAGDNIAFGLREKGERGAAVERRVTELLDLIRLPDVAKRYPAELSGGQQQRIALARALAASPQVLLMDEPLGALDLKLREAMQAELHRIQRALGTTTVLVTHDQVEAMSLSDRIAVMVDGRIGQVGTPEEIYHHPNTAFVAQFVGRINFFQANATGGSGGAVHLKLAEGQSARAMGWKSAMRGPLMGAVRPEKLSLHHGTAPSGLNALPSVVERRQFFGHVLHYTLRTAAGDRWTVEVANPPMVYDADDAVTVSWAPMDTLLFAGAPNGIACEREPVGVLSTSGQLS